METPSNEAIQAYYKGMRRFWHPVARIEDLEHGPIRRQLLGQWLTLARLEGASRCFDDVCRHMGASLSLGDVVDDQTLRCVYHGWSYDASGKCIDIPTRRGKAIPKTARVDSYNVQERYGLVWVCLDDRPRMDIPDFPEHDNPTFRIMPACMGDEWKASAPRIIMGALDDTHFPWVHPGLLGDRDHPEAPEHTAWREGPYAVSRYVRPHTRSDSGDTAPEQIVDRHRLAYCTPSTIRLVITDGDSQEVVFQALTPLDFGSSLLFVFVGRDHSPDTSLDQQQVELQRRIQDQDKPVVESQRPWMLPPMTSRLLLYVRPADVTLLEYQKYLEEAGIPQV